MARVKCLMLGLILLAGKTFTATATTESCLIVRQAAADPSAANIHFVKASATVDHLCPGVTYGVTISFPQARPYQLVSTRGAFQDPEPACVNHVTRMAAVVTGHEKLYLGCAAQGELQLHMLSTTPAGELVAKSATWGIAALSECPASPCNKQTESGPASTASSKPKVTSTDDGNTVIELTGNPLADLQMLYEMLMSGATPFSLPTSMDAGTAFQLVDIVRSMQEGPMTAATMLTSIQRLLNLVPAENDFMGMVSGMKTFLAVMEPYLVATPAGPIGSVPGAASTAASALSSPGGAMNMLLQMASMASGAAATSGTTGATSGGLASMLTSLGSLMTAGTAAATPTATSSATGSASATAPNLGGLTSMLSTLITAASQPTNSQAVSADSAAAPNAASMLSTLNSLSTLMTAGASGTAPSASAATGTPTAAGLDTANLLSMMTSLLQAGSTAAAASTAGSTANSS